MYERLLKSASHIRAEVSLRPRVGIVLGSGLGKFVDEIENPTIIPYSEIPHFKKTTVEGHDGRLILGKVAGVEVAVLQGRSHAYEGMTLDEVVFPIRTLSLLGVKDLILTNAAGGINLSYKPGDLVIIKDHINFMGKNPLVGPNNNDLGPRFPDLTQAYNPDIITQFQKAANGLGRTLAEGVYIGVLGPTYETPSEIKMMRVLGADMVGMSTVPECIAANHLSMRVGGISCITNMGAGIAKEKLAHSEIKEAAGIAMNFFSQLLTTTIKNLYV